MCRNGADAEFGNGVREWQHMIGLSARQEYFTVSSAIAERSLPGRVGMADNAISTADEARAGSGQADVVEAGMIRLKRLQHTPITKAHTTMACRAPFHPFWKSIALMIQAAALSTRG